MVHSKQSNLEMKDLFVFVVGMYNLNNFGGTENLSVQQNPFQEFKMDFREKSFLLEKPDVIISRNPF